MGAELSPKQLEQFKIVFETLQRAVVELANDPRLVQLPMDVFCGFAFSTCAFLTAASGVDPSPLLRRELEFLQSNVGAETLGQGILAMREQVRQLFPEGGELSITTSDGRHPETVQVRAYPEATPKRSAS